MEIAPVLPTIMHMTSPGMTAAPPSDTGMAPSSHLEVDLTAIDHNIAALRQLLEVHKIGDEPPLLCAAVKADAYGMGLLPIASRLSRTVDMLAVYAASEARELVAAGITTPVFVLSPVRGIDRTSPLYRTAVTGRLHLSLHDFEQIESLNEASRRLGSALRVHLYVDTGMSRSGIGVEDVRAALELLNACKHLELTGIYTHFATADDKPDYAREQLERLDRAIDEHAHLVPEDTIIHAANSFAAYRDTWFHRDMIRAGLAVYGYGPELLGPGDALDAPAQLTPAVRWVSRINHIRTARSGDTVGYGSTHKLWKDARIGVVPVGYGDGYPLALSNKAVVTLHAADEGDGAYSVAPVIGRVSMDQIVIDLTNAPDAGVDTPVVVYNNDPSAPNAVPALAELAGTHCYELLTRISPRVERRYLPTPGSDTDGSR